jgi:hypothetical protein
MPLPALMIDVETGDAEGISLARSSLVAWQPGGKRR